MEILMQLYQPSTGKRTEPVAVDRQEMAEQMRNIPDLDDCVVIALMEKLPDCEDWQFTLAPLYNARDFITFFGANNHGGEKI